MPIAALCLALLHRQAPTAADILDHVRSAVHYDALQKLSQGVVMEGTARYFGLNSTYQLMFTPSGEYLDTVTGELPEQAGFDGKTAWEKNLNGGCRELFLQDRDTQNGSEWFDSYRWLASDSPFVASLEKGSTAAGYDLLLVMKGTPFEERVHVDAGTWLPTVATITTEEGGIKYTPTSWKVEMGVNFPHHTTVTAAGQTNVYDITNVHEAPTFIRDPYEYLPSIPSDTTFDASVPPKIEAQRVFTGHILVHPRINGKDVGWFILDSGAGGIAIDTKTADGLGLKAFGTVPTSGIAGIVQAHFRHAATLKLGPATVANPILVEIDLGAIGNVFGVKLAGIIGYDFLRRCVMELDLTTPKISVFDPKTYKLPSGPWQDLILNDNHPVVQAKFPTSNTGPFRIDTGASGTLVFSTPFVHSLGLMKGVPVTDTPLGGVGGITTAKSGKIAWFELAGHRFEKPLVMFSQSNTGPLASRYLVGNIGQDFLAPFTMVFNYPELKIAFIKKPV
jgi:hypothetical protein